MSDALALFFPATRTWFHERYREPTPPQELGRPSSGGRMSLSCHPRDLARHSLPFSGGSTASFAS